MYQRDVKALSSHVLVDSALEDIGQSDEGSLEPDPVVSFYAELPLPLQVAMTNFIERYPKLGSVQIDSSCFGRLSCPKWR